MAPNTTLIRIVSSLLAAAALGTTGGCVVSTAPGYGAATPAYAATGPMQTTTVDATTFPTGPSSITIPPGTAAVIQANGVWSVGGSYGMFGAEGSHAEPRFEPRALVPSAPMGTLVGSFDGASWFPIGLGPTRVVGAGTGQLWLSTNDAPPAGHFTDNSGTLNVLVTPVR